MPDPAPCRILFLTANPDDRVKLALGEECREVEEKVRLSERRDLVDLQWKWAVRPGDLLDHLNRYRPQAVHFSGHGSERQEIVLLDQDRRAKPVSKEALRATFTTLRDNIRLVVLNACYSRPQAEAITEVIDCAVGMGTAIGDRAAVVFAAAFYRAVGYGRSVKDAFDQGKAALLLEGIPEENTPVLHARAGVDPGHVFLVPPPNP